MYELLELVCGYCINTIYRKSSLVFNHSSVTQVLFPSYGFALLELVLIMSGAKVGSPRLVK